MYFVALCCNGKTKNLVVRTRRVFKGFAFLLLQIELFNEIGKTKFKLKKFVKAVLLSCSVHNINASTWTRFFKRNERGNPARRHILLQLSTLCQCKLLLPASVQLVLAFRSSQVNGQCLSHSGFRRQSRLGVIKALCAAISWLKPT